MENINKDIDNSVLIVIPALNEEKTIAAVIRKAVNNADVLVVDDGSSDNTSIVAEDAGAKILKLEKNRGVDGALTAGFQEAARLGYKIVATIDADGQHDTELLEQIIEPVRSGRAMICHSARHDYARFSEWLLRQYSNKMHGYKDILSGLKCFDIKVFTDNPEFVSTPSLGTAIPWLVHRSGGVITEVDIRVNDRVDTPRIGGVFKANYRVIKALFRLIYWDVSNLLRQS